MHTLFLSLVLAANPLTVSTDADAVAAVKGGDTLQKSGAGTLLVWVRSDGPIAIEVEGSGNVYLAGTEDYSAVTISKVGTGTVYWRSPSDGGKGKPPTLAPGVSPERVQKSGFMRTFFVESRFKGKRPLTTDALAKTN